MKLTPLVVGMLWVLQISATSPSVRIEIMRTNGQHMLGYTQVHDITNLSNFITFQSLQNSDFLLIWPQEVIHVLVEDKYLFESHLINQNGTWESRLLHVVTSGNIKFMHLYSGA